MAVIDKLGQCLRRYRLVLLLGLALVCTIQLFLAYKSAKLYLEIENSGDDKSSNYRPLRKTPRIVDQQQQGIINSASFFDDEDDVHSNSNVYSKIMQKSAKSRKSNSIPAASVASGEASRLVLKLEELTFTPACTLTSKEAISAVQRAKTEECKRIIVDTACAIQLDQFYAKTLPNFCPHGNYTSNLSLGCYKDEKNFRLLSGYYVNFKASNSPQKCIRMCLQSGFLFAGVQYGTECFCGSNEITPGTKLPDSSCNMKCSGDNKSVCGGYFTMNVYETGIAKFAPQPAELVPKAESEKVRIVFLLTLNGRALRQVHRLLKALYSRNHYYYIHVDSRQDYLYRELLQLEKKLPNVRLTRTRFSTIWGGASLLQMLLSAMRELLASDWDWDFVINLSESDFPVKSVDKLVDFMTANRNKNFVRSHGRETQRFIQKQGLDKTFVECDTHMWRIGDRELPHGIQIDGGSDWVALSKDFVGYVTEENDQDRLLEGLLKVFKHTLLPAESFFHTVLRNSRFCESYIDNNLHVTNWKRRLGCKCQYKHVVDWCGCSPNDFKPDDWGRLLATEAKQLFFARKFEPIINQAVILQLEEWLFGPYPTEMLNLNSYWQNIYHHKDKSPKPDDGLLTVATSLIRTGFVDYLKEVIKVKIKRDKFNILEVINYMEYDRFKGFLVLFEATVLDGDRERVAKFEILARGTQLTQSNKKSKLAKRITLMEVSTEFDQKEQVMRNLPRVLGPFSEPVLVFHIKGSKSENETSYNLTVLWIDPAGNLADISDVTVEDQPSTVSISFAKSNLKHPLTPGIWTAKLITKSNAIAFCKFLVTPLEFWNGKYPIVESKGKVINLGTRANPKQSEYDKYLLPIADRQPFEDKILQNASKTGPELSKWIDYLVKHFFLVHNHCVVVDSETNYEMHDRVLGKKLEACPATSWSSFAPDPKSDIGVL